MRLFFKILFLSVIASNNLNGSVQPSVAVSAEPTEIAFYSSRQQSWAGGNRYRVAGQLVYEALESLAKEANLKIIENPPLDQLDSYPVVVYLHNNFGGRVEWGAIAHRFAKARNLIVTSFPEGLGLLQEGRFKSGVLRVIEGGVGDDIKEKLKKELANILAQRPVPARSVVVAPASNVPQQKQGQPVTVAFMKAQSDALTPGLKGKINEFLKTALTEAARDVGIVITIEDVEPRGVPRLNASIVVFQSMQVGTRDVRSAVVSQAGFASNKVLFIARGDGAFKNLSEVSWADYLPGRDIKVVVLHDPIREVWNEKEVKNIQLVFQELLKSVQPQVSVQPAASAQGNQLLEQLHSSLMLLGR